MIDPERFRIELGRVLLTFPSMPVMTVPMIEEYYRTLSPEMTTEQFVAACDQVRTGRYEFFPRPAVFLELGREEDGATLEYRAHETCTAIYDSRNWTGNGRFNFLRPEFRDSLDSRALFALEAIGEQRIDTASERDRDFLRREFVKRYLGAAEHELASLRRLAGRRWSPTVGAISTGEAIDAFAPKPPKRIAGH